MKAIDELKSIAHSLPTIVLEDIYKRITDWVSSGGDIEAPYIIQQLNYAKRILQRNDKEGDL